MSDTVAIVMPMYNEERHVVATLASVPSTVDFIVVVDDGSRDGSAAAVAALTDPRLVVARHTHRKGVGAALLTGFAIALNRGASIVVTMDADGQMDPNDLSTLLAPLQLGEADYVKGCRFTPGASLGAMPFVRRWGNRILSAYCRAVLAEPELRDVHCGYTAARRPVLTGLAGSSLHPSYGVYNDILARVLRMPGCRVKYVPVRAVYGAETSHIRLRDLVRLAGLLLRLIKTDPAAIGPPTGVAELNEESRP